MELVKAEAPITKRGRSKAVNQFDNAETIAAFKTGETYRINLATDANGNVTEKPHSVVNALREVADNNGHKVSVALDEGTAKLTDAKTFRVKWVPREPAAPTTPAATTPEPVKGVAKKTR